MTNERDDLIETLRERRQFLRQTLVGMADEQAGLAPTASELCLGGLVKHVADTESSWSEFMRGGAHSMDSSTSEYDYAGAFRMGPGDTVASVLARYDEVAATTDELVRTLDLDASYPLPEAPWFEAGKSWSVRRVVLHIIGETAQHSGHADIIRETIDGARTMG